MSAMPSLRQRALLKLRENFRAIEPDAGEDPYPFKFSIVEIGHLPDTIGAKRNAVGIVVGDERKTPLFPEVDVNLPVTIEWRIVVNGGDAERYGGGEPAMAAEVMLLAVQRVLGSDKTLGGLVIDVFETGNSVDLEAYADKTVAGVVVVDIQYRHDEGEPRTYCGGLPNHPDQD